MDRKWVEMYSKVLEIVEHIPYAFLIIDQETLEILDGNTVAKNYFQENGVFVDTKVLFSYIVQDGVRETIGNELAEKHRVTLHDALLKKQGKEQLADVEISVIDAKLRHLYVLVKFKTENDYLYVLQELCDDLLYRIDVNSKVLYFQDTAAKGYGMPSMIQNFPESATKNGIIHPMDIEKYQQYGRTLLRGEAGTLEARMLMKSGNYDYHKFISKIRYDIDGEPVEIVGKGVNIQQTKDLELKATVDKLTGALNKDCFEVKVKELLSRSSRSSEHALFFMDLDNFKGINDGQGHSFGDFLLSTVGKRLKSMVRETDFVGRVGGDEFVVFLNSFADEALVRERAQMILESIAREYVHSLGRAKISCSIGMALYPQHGEDFETLYQNADKALYQSKGLGKNRASIYSNITD